MPRLTESFRRFEDRLDEIKHLQLIAAKYNHLRAIINDKDKAAHSNALVRSATVLLSSHIQGYIEDISDLIVRHLINDQVDSAALPDSLRFYATKSAISAIRETSDPEQIVNRIRHYSTNFAEVLFVGGAATPRFAGTEYKDGLGNPTVEEIRKFFNRFGIKDYSGQMGKRLRNEWPIVENAVNQIVDRRNKIAHGDTQATLTVRELNDYVKLIRKFASASDRVVTSHFTAKGCKFWAPNNAAS